MRLGLYGGTFSPPHKGHVRAAEEFLRVFELDRLIIMPASIPPHKKIDSGDDPHHRYNMTCLAFEPLTRCGKCEVSTLELDRTGVSYTYETLTELYRIYGLRDDHSVYMLCGTDMFLTLDRWREPETIFRLAHIVAVSRMHGDSDDIDAAQARYERDFGAKISRLMTEPLEVSSTEIRKMISDGRIADVIDGSVADYIRKAGLYADA